GTTTQVHHLAYGGWPDHTAPSSPLPTVVLLKLARILSAGNPITVHCSAGIGRSATFIGIDYAVQKILQNPNTSMIEVLKDLRNQRFHAIQSAIQYTFLHVCIIEVFIEDGVVSREGNVQKFFDAYNRMLKKYRKVCEPEVEVKSMMK
ncbi:Protein-tyrosine phosphatase, partial [Ostertagia ostertagi]